MGLRIAGTLSSSAINPGSAATNSPPKPVAMEMPLPSMTMRESKASPSIATPHCHSGLSRMASTANTISPMAISAKVTAWPSPGDIGKSSVVYVNVNEVP